MPPMFTRHLAERLAAAGHLCVREGRDGQVLRGGEVWIAPGGYHTVLSRNGTQLQMRLNEDPPENSCRPAADVLFRSAAAVCGARTLAVVLTGMGRDGMRGCEKIVQAGGQVLAQDKATSVVWGMPGQVAQAGLADEVLPLDRLGEGNTPPRGPPAAGSFAREDACRAVGADSNISRRDSMSMNASSFEFIRQLVMQRSAIVLDESKGYLVQARLLPLVRTLGLPSIDQLVLELRKHPDGHLADQVVDAMTTNETFFFRDAVPFDALRDDIIPRLLACRASSRRLSIWCAACSTGQEPYSVAMLIREHFRALPRLGRAHSGQ